MLLCEGVCEGVCCCVSGGCCMCRCVRGVCEGVCKWCVKV